MKIKNELYAGKSLTFSFGVVELDGDGVFAVENESVARDIAEIRGFELVSEEVFDQIVEPEPVIEPEIKPLQVEGFDEEFAPLSEPATEMIKEEPVADQEASVPEEAPVKSPKRTSKKQ